MKKLISKEDSFFVAGHNGMVGSAVIRSLKKKGYCSEKYSGKLFTADKKDVDLRDFKNVLKWFKKNKPRIVILAAAKVGGILANQNYPFDFISDNLRIQQNVIESAWETGCKRFMFLGSSCIYPKNSKTPIKEEELLKSKLEKTNEPYAIAKIAGIKLCEALRKQHGFDAISLMPTNLYGTNDNYDLQNSHVLPALVRKFFEAKMKRKTYITCWGTGNPTREFLHVDDLADAIIHCLEFWDPNHSDAPKNYAGEKLNYLNVGSGFEISIKDLAHEIANCINYKGKIIWDSEMPDGTFRKNLDCSRIKSLGWESKISLKNGLRMTIEEFRRNFKN
ncbi:GDP-L-fucose synthase family protein [Prochlorococcus marinus]|nr:GDP-L-fucose synthase [Prochlorococcus marinus]